MKNFLFTLIFTFNLFAMPAFAQQNQLPEKAFDLYPSLQEMYGYAYGWHNNQLLIVGGRIKSDVPEISLEDFPNTELLLLDFDLNRATAFSTGGLEGIIFEQMSSAGVEFYQKGKTLYIIGGYGYHDDLRQFITFPYITAINLENAVAAMLIGENPVSSFYQLCDDRLAIYDGILDHNEQEYFLIHGKKAHKTAPFSQEPNYQEEDMYGQVRTFQIKGTYDDLKIEGFQTWYDLKAFYDYYGPLLPDNIREEVLEILNLQEIK